jgi:hypothetical protein
MRRSVAGNPEPPGEAARWAKSPRLDREVSPYSESLRRRRNALAVFEQKEERCFLFQVNLRVIARRFQLAVAID